MQAQWFHSRSGLATLAGQLQLAEVCYEVMPHLWQLNTVGDPTVQMIGPEGDLVRLDWSLCRMTGFWWLRSGPFAAVARYEHTLHPGCVVYVPVVRFGPFHTAPHVRALRDRLARLLRMPLDWANFGWVIYGDWRPGVVVVVPDPVSGVRVQQALNEGKDPVAACILDVHGQVLRPMEAATFLWTGWNDPTGANPRGLPSSFRLGIPHEVKPELEQGAFAALNGVTRWRLFYESIAPMPGLPVEELVETSGVPEDRVKKILGPMTGAGVTA